MKKVYSVVMLALTVAFTYAQSLSPTVIASTGGFSQNANGSLSYTVGEMTMVETFSSGNSILTQGFQQPNDNITGLLDMVKDEFGSLVVYPNPAVDNLWLGFQLPESGRVTITITNDIGQTVAEVYSGNYSSGKVVEQTNVSTFAAGLYFLNMTFTADKDGKVYTTTKKFQVII